MDNIPATEENRVKYEDWDTLQYGWSFLSLFFTDKDIKVYETEQVPGFVRLYDTRRKSKEIYRYKNNRLQDGIFRFIYSNGDSIYGTRTFAKSNKNGEEERDYRLFKYANGNIEYQEKIIIDQDLEWIILNKYEFNPNNLAWEKVDLYYYY